MKRFTWLMVASAAAAMLVTAACGGVSSSDKTATAQAGGTPGRSPTATTPGAGGGVLTGTPAVQVTPSPAGTGTPAAATATVPAGGGSVVSISASNILFDKNELEAKAGAITVQFDNKDSGIPHNFSVYKSKDDLTNPIAATEIATGPVMLTLQLNLEKGEYYFDCQVHPTTMNGTLKVE